MTTAAPSIALATIQPAFTDPERLVLAGFLAGYRGLTREAVRTRPAPVHCLVPGRSLPLFAVRRADIESFARELEVRGRARATVTQRLCTIAGFYKYAVELAHASLGVLLGQPLGLLQCKEPYHSCARRTQWPSVMASLPITILQLTGETRVAALRHQSRRHIRPLQTIMNEWRTTLPKPLGSRGARLRVLFDALEAVALD